MAGDNGLAALSFTVDTRQHEQNTITVIHNMENNKAIVTDGVHVEMLKTNVKKTAKLLTGILRAVSQSTIVPKDWLECITVPLFKGKGSQ